MAHVDLWYDFASTYSYPAAMRIDALAASRSVLRPSFSRGVFLAEFAEGLSISEGVTLEPLVRRLGLDPMEVLEQAQSDANDANKERLKGESSRAAADWTSRRALPGRLGRRSLLGQRSAGGGAGMGAFASQACDPDPPARLSALAFSALLRL
jgi:hypothetical protein